MIRSGHGKQDFTAGGECPPRAFTGRPNCSPSDFTSGVSSASTDCAKGSSPCGSASGTMSSLLAISAALTLPNLGGPSLWDVDEGVNAQAAREMRDVDTWIVPTFDYRAPHRQAGDALLAGAGELRGLGRQRVLGAVAVGCGRLADRSPDLRAHPADVLAAHRASWRASSSFRWCSSACLRMRPRPTRPSSSSPL